MTTKCAECQVYKEVLLMMWIAVYIINCLNIISGASEIVLWKVLGMAFLATWLFYLEISIILLVYLLAKLVISIFCPKIGNYIDILTKKAAELYS